MKPAVAIGESSRLCRFISGPWSSIWIHTLGIANREFKNNTVSFVNAAVISLRERLPDDERLTSRWENCRQMSSSISHLHLPIRGIEKYLEAKVNDYWLRDCFAPSMFKAAVVLVKTVPMIWQSNTRKIIFGKPSLAPPTPCKAVKIKTGHVCHGRSVPRMRTEQGWAQG